MNSVWSFVLGIILLVGSALAQDPLQLTIYATGSGDALILRWVEVPDATEYWVYAGDHADDDYLVIGGNFIGLYTDYETNHASRFYRVEAWRFDGNDELLASSDTVGYFAIDVPTFGYFTFGLPGFEFLDLTETNEPIWCTRSDKPSDILDEQTYCGQISFADRVIRQGGSLAYRNTNAGCSWASSLETNSQMRKSCAYWLQTMQDYPRHLVFAGVMHPCEPLVVDSAIVGGNTYKSYSWATVRNIPREVVGTTLLRDGFQGGTIVTSDKVIEQGNGYFYFDTSDSTWRGTLLEVKPTKAYWIQGKHAQGFTYRWRP